MNDKTNILVTGASSRLLKRFIEKIDRDRFSVYGITRQRSGLHGLNIEVLEGDILDTDFVSQAVENMNWIIHGAAVTHSYSTQEYFDVNYQGTINLVDASVGAGIDKFVFISSRTASSNGGAYAASKLRAEEYISGTRLSWLVLRLSEVYGGDKREGIDNLIQKIATKKFVFYPANVKSKLFPIHINDVAGVMDDIIFNKKMLQQVVIVNGKKGYSYSELVKQIARSMNKRIGTVPIPESVMYLGQRLMKFCNIESGIYPDQIPRLYCKKNVQHLDYDILSFEDYLSEL